MRFTPVTWLIGAPAATARSCCASSSSCGIRRAAAGRRIGGATRCNRHQSALDAARQSFELESSAGVGGPAAMLSAATATHHVVLVFLRIIRVVLILGLFILFLCGVGRGGGWGQRGKRARLGKTQCRGRCIDFSADAGS